MDLSPAEEVDYNDFSWEIVTDPDTNRTLLTTRVDGQDILYNPADHRCELITGLKVDHAPPPSAMISDLMLKLQSQTLDLTTNEVGHPQIKGTPYYFDVWTRQWRRPESDRSIVGFKIPDILTPRLVAPTAPH